MLIAALLAAMSSATPAAAPLPIAASGAATRPALDAYPAAEVALPGGVRGLPCVTFSTPEGFRPLTLDLYLPPAATPRPPGGAALVAFVHGGAWLGGDSRASGAPFLGAMVALAARGHVVAALNYRLSGEARFPAQGDDVAAALAFLRAHASAYGLDPGRVVLWGVSAGGMLAALAATSCGATCPRGVVAWYAPLDMATIADQARAAGALSRDMPQAPEWRLLGCVKAECEPARLRGASPAALVAPGTAPMLLVAGDADRTVPVAQTTEMAARLADAGVDHETMVLPGLDHNLTGATPAATRAGFAAALAATFRFIDRVTGATPR